MNYRVFKFYKIKFDGEWTRTIAGENVFEYKAIKGCGIEIAYDVSTIVSTAKISVPDGQIVCTHIDVVHVYGTCVEDKGGDNVKCGG